MSVHPFCPSSHYINQELSDNAKSLCIKMSGLVPSLNTSSQATDKVAKISGTQLRRRDKMNTCTHRRDSGKSHPWGGQFESFAGTNNAWVKQVFIECPTELNIFTEAISLTSAISSVLFFIVRKHVFGSPNKSCQFPFMKGFVLFSL